MACACKVNQQINEIQRKYGVGKKKHKNKFNINFLIILKQIFIYIISILSMPLMVVYLLWATFFNKKHISIKKIFNLK